MRKFLKLLVAFCMCATVTACSSSSSDDEGSSSAADGYEIAMITDTGSVTDKSFNQSAYEACEEFGEENGLTYKYYKPQETDSAGLLETVDQCVDNGAKVIVCPGFNFHEAIYNAQEKYPDVKFCLIDTTPYTDEDGELVADNTVVYLFQEQESGYMAGYTMVKEGFTKLGFMGGMSNSAVINYGVGFLQGASEAAQELDTDVEIKYHYTQTFSESPEIKTLSSSWYQDGVEVIFACGGSICNSVFAAAEEDDMITIGVDTDQSEDSTSVFTSALKDVKGATKEALQAYLDGDYPGGQTIVKANCGDIVYNDNFQTLTEDEYNEAKSGIVDGTIDLYNYQDCKEDGDPTNIDFPNVTVAYE